MRVREGVGRASNEHENPATDDMRPGECVHGVELGVGGPDLCSNDEGTDDTRLKCSSTVGRVAVVDAATGRKYCVPDTLALVNG